MLPSGNDAAYTLAEYGGYLLVHHCFDDFLSEQEVSKIDLTKESTALYVQEFLRAMNDKARSLGLTATWFSNPHGLPNALNTSSAKDIIKLSRHAVKNPLFRRIVNSREH
jgi:D-alanyl-D-alanine carboxypeptidase